MIFLALYPKMATENVHEILSVCLRIHKCRKDIFSQAYRVLCVKLSQQVNVASFLEFQDEAIQEY